MRSAEDPHILKTDIAVTKKDREMVEITGFQKAHGVPLQYFGLILHSWPELLQWLLKIKAALFS